MKRKLALVLAALVSTQAGPLGAATTTVDAKITAATVYNDRALVTRTATTTLARGDQILIFDGIPLAAEEVSIRPTISGPDASIYGIKHRVKDIGVPDSADQFRLQSVIDSLANNVAHQISDQIAMLERQKSMLEAFADGSGELSAEAVKAGFNAGNWATAYAFVSSRLPPVVDSLRLLGIRLKSVNERIRAMKILYQENVAVARRQVRSAAVEVVIETPGVYVVAIEYVVPNASWRPLYHARLGDSNLVVISCFGQVQQQTGEDWDDVEITLSTAQPGRTATPGELVPRLLSVREVMQQFGNVHIRGGRNNEVQFVIDGVACMDPIGGLSATERANLSGDNRLEDLMIIKGGFDAEYGNGNPGIVNPAYVFATEYSTQFRVRSRQTIPSGGEVVRTPINEWTMAGDSRLVIRPRNQLKAFRFVSLTNETGVPLLPGQINLFAGADFIGSLNSPFLIMPTQKFELAFGIDDRIEVKREIVNQRRSANGDSRKLEETVVITLINHGPNTEEVELEEALPVSSDSRIKVKTKAIVPKGDDSMGQGINRWQLELQSGVEAAISITYEIEHPASLQLLGM